MSKKLRRDRRLAQVILRELGADGPDRPTDPRTALIASELMNLRAATPEVLGEPLAAYENTQYGRDGRRALEAALVSALNRRPDISERLWFLVSARDDSAPSGSDDGREDELRDRLPKWLALLMFLGATVGSMLAYFVLAGHQSWQLSFVKGAAFLVFSSLPGWLYVRFLEVKAAQVREDYVLSLHRLGVDDPRFLPEPPKSSIYYDRWDEEGAAANRRHRTIYMDKFEAQFGHARGRSRTHERTACLAALLPVGVVGFICAVGWGSILLDPSFLTAVSSPTPTDVMRFGFLGAYAFVVQMLLRRYLQQDLRPSTYVSASVRFLIVFILTFVIYCAWPSAPSPAQLAVAFLVGFFPIVGMQWLHNVVAAMLRRGLPSLRADYPLAHLDGLNVWYEAQLLEVGVEDMQNLMTANVVDIILNTRVPVGRLVDWIDQAALLLHLPADDNERSPQGKSAELTPRATLRGAGIRCATDLEAVFRSPSSDSPCPQQASEISAREEQELRRQMISVLDSACQQPPSTVLTLLKTFRHEPNLIPVRNWRHDWRASCAVASASEPILATTQEAHVNPQAA